MSADSHHLTQNSEGNGSLANLMPFKPGQSGNPGGRPRGLARRAREKLGNDGERLLDFWIEVMDDVTRPTRERLEASKLLAERGWGKPASFQLIEEDDPLERDDAALEEAVAQFGQEVRRLAAIQEAERASADGIGGDLV